MTRKQYASIKCAIEASEKIKQLTDHVLHGHVTQAYNAIKEIAAINDKYLKDFKDVDLYWAPDRKTGAPKTAAPRQQPVYTPPAPAYNYQENDPIYDEELIS